MQTVEQLYPEHSYFDPERSVKMEPLPTAHQRHRYFPDEVSPRKTAGNRAIDTGNTDDRPLLVRHKVFVERSWYLPSNTSRISGKKFPGPETSHNAN